MKRLALTTLTLFLLVTTVGCSKKEDTTTTDKQEKQIETLTQEKRTLELLLENEKQKTSASSSSASTTASSDSEMEETNTEELPQLFDSFIRAQFEQDQEALKPLTTATLYTILVDKAGERETSVSFKSTVKEITLYQAETTSDTEAVLVGKINVETQVSDYSPNRYQQLVECTAIKSSEGQFQIATQTLTTLAQ